MALGSHEELLQKAMRSLREELKLTQVQLSNLIRLTPTSIYRYEAAETFPDTATLVKLWDFALQSRVSAAVYFSELLGELVPPLRPLIDKLAVVQEERLEATQLSLEYDHRVLVMALIKMLTTGPDTKVIQILHILLQPWLESAREDLLEASARNRDSLRRPRKLISEQATPLASVPTGKPHPSSSKAKKPSKM